MRLREAITMSTAELSTPLAYSTFYSPSLLRRMRMLWCNDLAMDLGTANTLIYVRKHGIVLNEPSVVAVEEGSKKPLAVGHAAKDRFGKTSGNVQCIRPMKDGVIADFDVTTAMIERFLARIRSSWSFKKPRIVIGVPSGITQVEKRAVIEAALCSGVSEVLLAEEPMAAALGAGLPVDQAIGNMIVDIGGGTTEVAIISLNSTIYSHSIRVAGDEMDEAIQRYVRRRFGVEIGIFDAEKIKVILGSALPMGRGRSIRVMGRDLAMGYPKEVEVDDELVREALDEPIGAIISSIMTGMEQITPELAQDIINRGVYLAGGGSLLKGLDERLTRETGIRFQRTQDPLSCVVRGVGQVIDNLRDMRVLCIS